MNAKNTIWVIIILGLIVASTCNAMIRTVSLSGTAQYTVIQDAINESADGDTVLVMPGRYFENINFNGHCISLASNNLFTNDSNDIANTILDGNQNGSVVSIANYEQYATIYGFTIINGSGTEYDAGWFYGGGILILTDSDNSINVIHCSIYNNRATVGGGIEIAFGDVYLKGNSIRSNYATANGGGIDISGSSVHQFTTTFSAEDRSSIYNNYAAWGTDIFSYMINHTDVIVDTFTVANPWNYYAGAVPENEDIINPYTFDILHTVHQEVNQDLYVAPSGNDSNSGLTPSEPLKTIALAVYKIASDSLNPKTVHLASGVYSQSLNSQLFPIPLKSYMQLTGYSNIETIIDGDGVNELVTTIPYNQYNIISQLHLRNGKSGINSSYVYRLNVNDIKITDCLNATNGGIHTYMNSYVNISDTEIDNCSSQDRYTGVYIGNLITEANLSNLTVSNCVSNDFVPGLNIAVVDNGMINMERCSFINNRSFSDWGNSWFQIGFFHPVERCIVRMTNCLFSGITQGQPNQMGVLSSKNGISYIENCTFADNSGGSVGLYLNGDVTLKNNVFYNHDLSSEIVIPNFTSNGTYSNAWLSYNNIRNGQNGVVNATPLNHLYWGDGNISDNPLFSNSGTTPYYLSGASPLIDAGTPDTTGMAIGLYDLAGNERIWDGNSDGIARADIGAYEYQPMNNPENLIATTGLNFVHLSWAMGTVLPSSRRSIVLPSSLIARNGRMLSGYRVYRDSIAIADIDNNQTLDYIDRAFTQSDTVTYCVVALYGTVESEPSNQVTVYLEYVHDEDNTIPALSSFSISPNPFINHTIIRYTLRKASHIDMKVYNLKGQAVKTITNSLQNKGDRLAYWDGRDDSGKSCSTGIYLVKLRMDGKPISSKKITLVK